MARKVNILIGATYDEMLLPKTSILVVPSNVTNSEKISYAAKHRIPVVSDTWLYESLENARKMSFSDYVVTGRPRQAFDHGPLNRSSNREASAAPPQDPR